MKALFKKTFLSLSIALLLLSSKGMLIAEAAKKHHVKIPKNLYLFNITIDTTTTIWICVGFAAILWLGSLRGMGDKDDDED